MYVCPRCCIQLIALQICSSCTSAFQHRKQDRQNTRQTFSQPLSDSFFYYIFPLLRFPFYYFISLFYCIVPQFCILEKSATCGVIRSYNFGKFKSLDFQECSSTVYVGSDFPRAEGHSKTWISRHTRAIQPLPVRLCCVVGGSLSVLSVSWRFR